jgi:hypothetical protein
VWVVLSPEDNSKTKVVEPRFEMEAGFFIRETVFLNLVKKIQVELRLLQAGTLMKPEGMSP